MTQNGYLTGKNKGETMSSISIIYAATTVLSLLLAIGYCCAMKKKEIWLLLLYFSVFIVNGGYLCLSVSKTLGEALLANRIAYLGSAFLPLCMLMTIMNVCKTGYRKVATAILLPITCIVFLIAATPGYLDCYYKSVTIDITDGLTTLVKEYGPLHRVYALYLLMYFAIMIGITIYAIIKKRITSASHSMLLASVTLGNIAVWGIEQIIDIEFEFLSICYIITELFLLMLYIMLQVKEHTANTESEASVTTKQIPVSQAVEETEAAEAATVNSEAEETAEKPIDEYQRFCDGISLLTITERKIFDLYVSGKGTAETAEAVGIKENTLKFHNKNIYQKLGVSSRKQLLYYANLSNETKVSEN